MYDSSDQEAGAPKDGFPQTTLKLLREGSAAERLEAPVNIPSLTGFLLGNYEFYSSVTLVNSHFLCLELIVILTYYFYFQVSVSVLICWPHYPYKVKYCLYKNRTGVFYQVEKVEFLNLIIHDCQLFERLKNLLYRSTHSCSKI